MQYIWVNDYSIRKFPEISILKHIFSIFQLITHLDDLVIGVLLTSLEWSVSKELITTFYHQQAFMYFALIPFRLVTIQPPNLTDGSGWETLHRDFLFVLPVPHPFEQVGGWSFGGVAPILDDPDPQPRREVFRYCSR